ncbi:MAG: hypothetical protein HY753_06610 [Nitrospirae bacterium]|nr:hypothetical protein [Nitrospirota bacterium]
MWESKSSIIARELMSKWVEEDKHLQVCASLFAHDVKEVDIQILEKIFEKAKKYKDVTTLNNVIDSIVTNYSKCSEPKPLFIKSIKELTKNKNAGWVNNILHRPGSVWESLNEQDFEMIMENLLLVPRIDYHVEEILMPVANKYPQKAIHFFYKRVENKEKNKDDFSYDAIPFDLHNINEPLQKQAKVVIADIIKWYSQKIGRFEWEASHLIQAIFPAFNKELEKELIKLIKSKKEKNIKIVLSILRAYQGDPFLHNVCKNIVRHSPYVGKFKSSLFIILSQTGIVSGEDGFVNAYKQKLEDVQSWKKERSKAIRSFIKEYEDNLNKRILEEQKRADEDLKLRKREFGE